MLPNATPTVALSVTILVWTVALVSSANDEFQIELKQKDAEVYHEQSFGRNEFNYGYQVEKINSQFQHKVKGPDDVTYGCYGYIDPVGEKHLVYYIADRLGYRLLAPDQPTKVFTERVANSVNKLDADLQGRKLDEKVVAWNDLYLPSTCRRLNEIVSITPPPTPAPVVQTTTTVPNGGAVFNPIGPQSSATTERNIQPAAGSADGMLDGDRSSATLASDNSGTGNVQVPDVEESNQGGGSTEGAAPSIAVPQELPGNGLGLAVGTLIEAGDSHNNGFGTSERPNGEGQTGSGESPKNEEHDVSQITTLEPAGVVSNPAPPTTAEAVPAPEQVDPIVVFPGSAYIPIGSSTPQASSGPPATGEPPLPLQPNCEQGPDGVPFAPEPRYPASVGQFNGFVFPINRNCDASERSTAELLTQMQAINELVLKVSNTLHSLADASDRNATCQRVLELLDIQQPVPLLVYVPIMIPYLDGGINGSGGSGDSAGAQTPPINPASYAYAKACSDCK